ncbi:hypothetical protein C4559_01975 [Candidatus Microgenomates bacterium]|nr:MAG: hypothetical protein C4559_01975 [Candidatus Microgenomates bacterium]
MTDRQKALLSITLASFLGGATSSVTKIGLVQIPPLSFAFLRFFIASLFVILFVFKTKKILNMLKDFISLSPVSLFATVNIILFVIGIKTTTATIGQLLYAGTPLFTSLIAYILLKEKLNFQKIIGVILGFIGVCVIVFLPIIQKGEAFSGDLKGNFLIGMAVISWSFYMVFSAKAQKKYSPFEVVSMFIFLTTVILFPFFLADLNSNYGWWVFLNFKSVISIFYTALIATVFPFLLNQYAIKHGGSVFASTVQYLNPIFAFLAAFFLLGERLTLGVIIGALLALLGVFFVTRK